MKPDELDRILSRETEVTPSSGFTHAVMAAVRSEAVTPPPIPFPWVRALPGLAVWAIAIVWAAIESFRSPAQESVLTSSFSTMKWIDGFVPMVTNLTSTDAFGAGWILLALLMTAVCLELTWLLTRPRA